jgi:ribosomal protein S5
MLLRRLKPMEEKIIKLPITKALSIPHDVVGDFELVVLMRPSIEGSGVIAGGAVRCSRSCWS